MWAQHRLSAAVVTVQRVRRRLQIFKLTSLLTGVTVPNFVAEGRAILVQV